MKIPFLFAKNSLLHTDIPIKVEARAEIRQVVVGRWRIVLVECVDSLVLTFRQDAAMNHFPSTAVRHVWNMINVVARMNTAWHAASPLQMSLNRKCS